MAFRALLFAVFGGFIGAAPAAPPAGAGAGAGGCVDPRAQIQKLERPESVAVAAAHCVAGAPPSAGVPPAATPCSSAATFGLLPRSFVAALLVHGLGEALPPRADVRAGFLDLPPPSAL